MSATSGMSEGWAAAYRNFATNKQELVYPSETLVRLLRGDYLTGERPQVEGKSILDVGFGNGNNTVFLAALGMQVSGVEIHPEICADVGRRLASLGYTARLEVGGSRAIPFEDRSFDYLVSWNVLHYEGSEENVRAAIAEYARVLKPGGRLLLSSTGPGHKILRGSAVVGPHRYRIGRADDFREGQVHFLLEDEASIRRWFEPHFASVAIGRIEDLLFRDKLDWWLVTGTRH